MPGIKAHAQLAPENRVLISDHRIIEKTSRKGAVNIVLFIRNDQLLFPLIKRTIGTGVHSGQISLPGGRFDQNDKDFQETALRETKEEIGLELHEKQVLGKLTELYIPPSNFLITPFVSLFDNIPAYCTQTSEVENIIECSLFELMNQEIAYTTEISSKYRMGTKIPYFSIRDEKVWGATAMVLNEFRILMKGLHGSEFYN